MGIEVEDNIIVGEKVGKGYNIQVGKDCNPQVGKDSYTQANMEVDEEDSFLLSLDSMGFRALRVSLDIGTSAGVSLI